MLRRSLIRRGLQTSNAAAHPATGRWWNPPHQWMGIGVVVSAFANQSHYSPYHSKNYYPTQQYTKEFIHKYDRTNRWRHY